MPTQRPGAGGARSTARRSGSSRNRDSPTPGSSSRPATSRLGAADAEYRSAREFSAAAARAIALRVADVGGGCAEARGGRGRRVPTATTSTPASATWRCFSDPDGNALMLHHRYAPYPTARRRRMQVEQVDFVAVPTRDVERAVAFYRDVLGLAAERARDGEVETPNVTLAFWNPEDGRRAVRSRTRRASRCASPTSPPRVDELREAGGEVIGDRGHRRLPHGLLQGSRRQLAHPAPEVRAAWLGPSCSSATARCRCRRRRTSPGGSPTSPGFDPDSFAANGAAAVAAAPTMLDIDAAGVAHVSEGGHRDRARARGGRVRAARATTRCSATLVGADEKFAAHNAALWEHGLLVHVPKGVVLEQPLYVRIANSVAGRLALLAAARRRRAGEPLHGDRGVRLGRPRASRATRTRSSRSSSSRPRRSSTSRSRTSRARPGTSPRTTRASERDAELDWVAGGFGSKKGKVRIQNDLAGPGATSRVTGAYFADGVAAPRLRHVPGAHRAEHDLRLRLQGRAARHGDRGLARDDPRREGRAEDERVPGEPQPAALAARRTPTRSRASRSSPTTCAARTARRSARSTASSSST